MLHSVKTVHGYAVISFLRWFLDEQIEEEKTVNDMIAKLKLAGDNANGLFLLDQQAGERAIGKPSPVAAGQQP